MDIAKTQTGYSRSHRAVELVSIVLVFVLLTAMAVRIARTVNSPSGWTCLVVVALTGYLTADLLSGMVHWAGDTLGDESTPFLGKNFVLPFRQHHIDPRDISRHDFIETNGNNCIVVLLPLGPAYVLMPEETGFGFFASALLGFLALFIVATNQFHKWAHTSRPPRFVLMLQRWGLILSPAHHDVHHAVPHDRHYCITVGWMNPLLNRINFFRGIEALIAAVRPEWLHLEERRLAAIASTHALPPDVAGRPRPL